VSFEWEVVPSWDTPVVEVVCIVGPVGVVVDTAVELEFRPAQ
jgi:hypothetical protein